MTQNEKDLLLKDLCARLPYGVKAEKYTIRTDGEIVPLKEAEVVTAKDILSREDWPGYMIRPYLFPLSSMTEEQLKEYMTIPPGYKTIDWFNKNHFDYRCLIERGSANDATGKNIY